MLTNRQEERILKSVREESYRKCDHYMRAFVDCTKNRSLSIPKACNPHYLEMNECLKLYNNDKVIHETILAYKQDLYNKNKS